ncbi:unnamed protein product [Gongylonema pulchrum]|uniref:Rad60-SLD domain-containing protein n=1 Tax=Gongylonema pulchrum TaxID=637853 RepID=A0A183ET30_9BILA|nr:unnamed protein product [Gongylonema pulchrum]
MFSLQSGKEISAASTPIELEFDEHDVNCLLVSKTSHVGNSGYIKLQWLLSKRKPIVSANVPFRTLIHDFAVDNGLDEEKLELVFDDAKIDLEQTAEAVGLEDNDCIDVYIKQQ